MVLAKKNIVACAVLSSLLLAGCSSNSTVPSNTNNSELDANGINAYGTYDSDPFQSYNRAMFKFNDALINTIIQPTTTAYTKAIPSIGRSMIHNFFSNILTIPDIGNDLLQGNFHYMFSDIARLIINTTLGIGGLFDVAAQNHIYSHSQGFGYTLARWGWTNSPYFVIPILGPSTVANTVGMIPDGFANPISYVGPTYLRYSLAGLGTLQTASEVVPKQQALAAISLDPYVALRNAYMQNQAHVMQQIDNDGFVPPSTAIPAGPDIGPGKNHPTEVTVVSPLSLSLKSGAVMVEPAATAPVASPAAESTPIANVAPATTTTTPATTSANVPAPAVTPALSVQPDTMPTPKTAPVPAMAPPAMSSNAQQDQTQMMGAAQQAMNSAAQVGVFSS